MMYEKYLDNGPWSVVTRMDGGTFIESDDPSHDVFLHVVGEFKTIAEKELCAFAIMEVLNRNLPKHEKTI